MARFKAGKSKAIRAVMARIRRKGGKPWASTLRALALTNADDKPKTHYQPSRQDKDKAADNYRRTLQSCQLNQPRKMEPPSPSA